MKARFVATWDVTLQTVPRGQLVLEVDSRYRKGLGKILRQLKNRQARRREKTGDPTARVELDVILEIHYRERSLDQNRLMWSLYGIEANVANGEAGGDREQIQTPEELYDADMAEVAPTVEIAVRTSQIEAVKQLATVKRIDPVPGSDLVMMHVVVTSSHWTTVQMAEHIERIFNRLAHHGVSLEDSADVAHWWREWRGYLADKEITLHGGECTAAEYRDANPLCEACGEKYIGDGSGQLAHISSVGSGVSWEDEKRSPADWFHLCHECHDEQHRAGIETWLKKWKHLRPKGLAALKRNG